MPLPLKKASSAESLATISHVVLTAFIFATLYIGRELLVPIALASLLTFLLSPLATRLQRWLGRVGAVLLIVAMMFAATGTFAWVVGRQAVDLANSLPNYKENIRTKLRAIQLPSSGPFTRLSQTVEELKKELPGGKRESSPIAPEVATDERSPMPVEIANGPDKRLEFVQVILGPLGKAGMVLLLLIFMLLERDDLRNRLIRLVGQGRISATTQAMEDAGSRVSRYLVMQLIINVSYGIPVAIGLSFIGVPNAFLWGALATVLRFIPYAGPWIAASFPVLLSLAVSPNWMMPMLTIALFIVLELISNNIMEPLLYGSSTGVTPIALIVAALVWTWLWGPVGLVLATPLTVCLVVLGRHIPRLAFLSVILSDEEVLTPAEDFYHRLHRVGEHDEMELVENYLKSNPVSGLFDAVMLPVVTSVEMDHRLGLIELEQLQFIEKNLNEVLENLELQPDAAPSTDLTTSRICVLPAKDYRDELAGSMLSHLLLQKGCTVFNASSKMVSGELVAWVREEQANIVCVSVVAPSTMTQAKYLCSKLRKELPEIKIIVGLWGATEKTVDQAKTLQEIGADEILFNLTDASERIVHYARIASDRERAPDSATLVQCAI
jgi:predicted PurR-regulated permease PerM/methylmalonyl-CoA mutase cobalamin-binding subunit